MKLRLDHIGLVIDRIDQAAELFRAIGIGEMTEPLANPFQKVSASFVPVTEGDPVYIELLEPTEDTSPISSFIRKRGGGLHHLCFEVDDIEAAMKEVERMGFRITVPVEDCSAYDENLHRDCSGTSRIAFFLLSDKILVEFIEKGQ